MPTGSIHFYASCDNIASNPDAKVNFYLFFAGQTIIEVIFLALILIFGVTGNSMVSSSNFPVPFMSDNKHTSIYNNCVCSC